MYSEAMLVDGILPLDKPCTARIGWREDPQEPSVTHINVGGKKKKHRFLSTGKPYTKLAAGLWALALRKKSIKKRRGRGH